MIANNKAKATNGELPYGNSNWMDKTVGVLNFIGAAIDGYINPAPTTDRVVIPEVSNPNRNTYYFIEMKDVNNAASRLNKRSQFTEKEYHKELMMQEKLMDSLLTLRNQGYELKRDFDQNRFEDYQKGVKELAKTVYNSSDNLIVRNNAIALLDLPVERSYLFRVFTVGKYQLNYLSRWNSLGKYEFYIDMVNRLLNAIIHNF